MQRRRSRGRACSVASSTKVARTASSVCRSRRPTAACTPRPPQSPFFPSPPRSVSSRANTHVAWPPGARDILTLSPHGCTGTNRGQGGRSAHRSVPRVWRWRAARQQDRERRAHHPRAQRRGGGDAGRALPAQGWGGLLNLCAAMSRHRSHLPACVSPESTSARTRTGP